MGGRCGGWRWYAGDHEEESMRRNPREYPGTWKTILPGAQTDDCRDAEAMLATLGLKTITRTRRGRRRSIGAAP